MTMMFRGRRRIATKNTKQIMFKERRGIVRFSDSHSFGSSRWVDESGKRRDRNEKLKKVEA